VLRNSIFPLYIYQDEVMIVIVFNYYEDWMYHKTVTFGYK